MTDSSLPVGPSVVAVYADHAAAEHAIRLSHSEGFAMADLSIVGRDFQVIEEPVGFISPGDYAKAGAGTGAWFGGLFGLLVGAAFLILPGVGPVVVAGPLVASIVAGLEGAMAGTALGALAGALVGLGVPKERALKYEKQVQGGKFLVLVRGAREAVARAHHLLESQSPGELSVYETAPAQT
jgi:hypothetical protein